MTEQLTRFTLSKATEVLWDDQCDQCDGAMFIARSWVPTDESGLVIYLECGSCSAVRTLTIESVAFMRSGPVCRMEV